MKASVWVLAALCLSLPLKAGAAVYSYKDEQGRLFLTDCPPNKRYKIIVTTKKEREAPDNPAKEYFSSPVSSRSFMLPNDETFSEYINEAAQAHSLDPYLIKSVIKVESDFDPSARSSKGAKGLMQLIPSTARLVGCNDVFNPKQNIMGGASYLRMLINRFDGDIERALAAYNAGPGNVEKYNGIPPFRETKNYVRKVKHYFDEYSSAAACSGKKLRCVRVMPVSHSNLSNRLTAAYERFARGEVQGAMNDYRDILSIYPSNTQALYNLACLLDMERCYEEAIDVYNAALKQDPFLDKAFYNLAVVYERLGMHKKAIQTWKKYASVSKDEEKIIMAERYIEELREYAALN